MKKNTAPAAEKPTFAVRHPEWWKFIKFNICIVVTTALSSFLYVIMVVFTILFDTWLGGVVGTIMQNNGWSTPVTELLMKCLIINVPTIWTYPLERFVIQRQRKKG